ncbi:hypothetical protein BJ875DRAFT_396231 [Amylocarpus encephaloides]|uniref:Uncharacterized protein n=1 Tax=Amylocarpus encephaloides TaxID=45428 RepID=A0A9P8C844_9HELO|nr:hypothetical protein BJ875DRAFT_396231 [Amylocarpus encephaloides]
MPLQKSFSDQNHSAKARQQQQNRPQWSRNKSFQGHQNPKQNSQSKSLQEKPALPVSTATKNKLSAFQFDRRSTENGKTGIDLVSSDDKENSGPSRKNSQKKSQGPGKPIGKQAEVEKVHEQLAEQAAKPEQAEQPLLPSLQRKNVPSTPASRLALPDLISMSDIQRAVQIISPDEKIEWDCTKDDSQASTPFGGIRRAKKRARSSSPMNSSPAQVSVGFSANNENPQLDPGTELWGRYSLNGPNAATPHGPSVPALAHLMQTSSPQPSKDGSTPRLISSFRRANSCGNQFPKRRKVRHSDGDVFTESENIEPSKLSVLIEQVQEGMSHRSRPSPQDESSSSSSTSPNEVSSPKNRRECRKSGLAEREEVPAAPPMRGDSATLRDDDPLVDLNSSDYGEFDDNELDVTMLVALEATSTQKPPTIVAQAAEKPSTTLQQASRHISNRGPTSKPLVKDVEDDEFGDLDDDVFDMELQQVASQFDRHAPISKPSEGLPRSPGAQHSGKLRSKPDSDDEFGGDGFDDDDFEAAVAATRSAHKNMIPVRTRYS